jgi:hypothetical protein
MSTFSCDLLDWMSSCLPNTDLITGAYLFKTEWNFETAILGRKVSGEHWLRFYSAVLSITLIAERDVS